MQVNSQPVNLSEDDLQVKPTDVELALQSCLVIGRDRSFFKAICLDARPSQYVDTRSKHFLTQTYLGYIYVVFYNLYNLYTVYLYIYVFIYIYGP